MIRIYGSPLCPDCRACKANFDRYGVEYEYFDVLANLANLKQFLIYRDGYPEVFDRLKAIHDIGLPACVDDETGKVFTDWETYLREKGLEPVALEGSAPACSLSGKGC